MASIRLTGLATGIDTDQMIKDLMKVERLKVDRVQQDKQVLQWRQQLYNELNKDFANFILDTKKEFGLIRSTSTGNMFNNSLSSLSWVKKAASSNEGIASVSSTSTAVNGSYEVNVERLADGVKAASSENVEDALKGILDGLGETDTIEFKISDGDLITIVKGDDMSSVVKKINASGAGVQASYDASIGRFFMQTTATGGESKLNIDANAGSKGEAFIDALKLNITSYDSNGVVENNNLIIGSVYNGVDALVNFAGATGITKPSNQFNINGINLDLKATGTITVRVDTNTDAAYDKIKVFVEKYNEIVDKMGKLLGEKQNRDFRPLTQDQKDAMSEKEIEIWEEKAKSGLLRNDSTISRTMQNVRGSLYNEVEEIEGPFKQLFEIGISTERWAAGAIGGKLEINEERLKKALTENVDGVLELLFKETSTVTEDGKTVTKKGSGGVVTRMYDTMISGMKEVINKAGTGEESNLFRNIRSNMHSNMLIDFVSKHSSISMLDKDMSNLDRRISDLNASLLRTENRFYSQFAAMEKFVQQMNNQGAWLSQQLG